MKDRDPYGIERAFRCRFWVNVGAAAVTLILTGVVLVLWFAR